MRVLMVGNSPSVKGGITTVIEQFLNYDWNSQNIDFKFIPTYKDNNNIVKILYFIIAYIRIFAFTFFKRPSIVHIHMSYKGSFTRAKQIQKLCNRLKIKTVIHLHGSEFKSWYDSCDDKKQQEIRKLIRSSYRFIVLGTEWKDRIIEIEPTAKIVVVNNTVNIPKESTCFADDKIHFLFLGVLIKRKGVHDLLDAISKISQEKLKKVDFIIAGTGDEENNLKEQCRAHKLDEYVRFIGWTDKEKKEKLLQECQYMILPSYNEGLPMSILEAISYGMPVVATIVGDIPEAVKDGYNGFLYKAGTVSKLTSIIDKLIDADEKEWKQLSSNAKKLATEKFSSDNYFEKFKKYIKESKI